MDAPGLVLDRARITLPSLWMQPDRVRITLHAVRMQLDTMRVHMHRQPIRLAQRPIRAPRYDGLAR